MLTTEVLRVAGLGTAAKLIAFYLPQFHPIPENSRWWGPGFTEWTNVAQSKPGFDGHLQPEIPADLGFYDLRLGETRAAQAELARRYGIDAFCYYHYWFEGRPLLERPLLEMLVTGDPDLPFCLCWANENWTRNWDGRSGEILASQSSTDEEQHFSWLVPFLRERRYVRIGGRPLLLIYRPMILRDPVSTAEQWRSSARRHGLGEIYLLAVESRHEHQGDPRQLGFDGAVEFQPDWGNLPTPIEKPKKSAGIRLFDYSTHVEKQEAKPAPPYPRFPCVFPAWDNTPRRRDNATVFTNAEPERYERWLRHAIKVAADPKLPEPIVFINAWNEWAEGAHLEPDTTRGHALLQATARARGSEMSPPPTDAFVWQHLSDSSHAGAAGQYQSARNDLLELLLRPPRVTLDVGCGTGGTASELKRRYPKSSVIGLEQNPSSAAIAARGIDRVIVSRVEDVDFAAHGVHQNTIDTVLALDVLEHLDNPLRFLKGIRRYLSDDAQVIISIPNSRNLWLVGEIIDGRFGYEKNGLLDITHIRFFSKKHAIKLLTDAGYEVVKFEYNDDNRLKSLSINVSDLVSIETSRATFKNLSRDDLQELKALQFYIVAQPFIK